MLTLSASTLTALDALAGRYATFLASHPEVSLADVCFTANTGSDAVRPAAGGRGRERRPVATAALRPRVGPDRAGHGARWRAAGDRARSGVSVHGSGKSKPGTGAPTFETQAAFREALLTLRPHPPRSSRTAAPGGALSRPGVATPLNETGMQRAALFALEYARLYSGDLGIVPAAVIGHSLGEYVAACVAGAFSLEDGLELVVERSRLMQTLPREGAMAAVFGRHRRWRRTRLRIRVTRSPSRPLTGPSTW